MLHVKSRLMYGRTTMNPPSLFLGEIPEALTDVKEAGYIYQKPQTSGKVYFSDKVSRASSDITVTKKPTQSSPSGEVFAPGDMVQHLTFGKGEVMSVTKMGSDVLYEIVFDRVGTKKLMATYARLKRV